MFPDYTTNVCSLSHLRNNIRHLLCIWRHQSTAPSGVLPGPTWQLTRQPPPLAVAAAGNGIRTLCSNGEHNTLKLI